MSTVILVLHLVMKGEKNVRTVANSNSFVCILNGGYRLYLLPYVRLSDCLHRQVYRISPSGIQWVRSLLVKTTSATVSFDDAMKRTKQQRCCWILLAVVVLDLISLLRPFHSNVIEYPKYEYTLSRSESTKDDDVQSSYETLKPSQKFYCTSDTRTDAAVYNSNNSNKNNQLTIELTNLSQINPQLVQEFRDYSETVVKCRKHTSTTRTPLLRLHSWGAGFGSNLLMLAKALATSLHTGRLVVTHSEDNWSYNCPTKAGYQCYFNTTSLFLSSKQEAEVEAQDGMEIPKSCPLPSMKELKKQRDEDGLPIYYHLSTNSSKPPCLSVDMAFPPKLVAHRFRFPFMLTTSSQTDTSTALQFIGGRSTILQLSICTVWNLNDQVYEEVRRNIQFLQLPLGRHYATLHVRRGDKGGKKEKAAFVHVRDYLSKVPTEIRDIVLASDGQETLAEAHEAVLQENSTLPPRTIHVLPSFLNRNETKAASKEMKHKSLQQRYQETVQLITEFELMADASFFVGTGSSNIGTIVTALRACRGHPEASAYSMDYAWDRQFKDKYKSSEWLYQPPSSPIPLL